MTIIADPLFYFAAVPAVTALGLSKGGFSGLGTLAVPLMALAVSPVQAMGILVPILLTQDVVTLWSYRWKWDAGILKVMIPGQIAGVCIAWLIAAYVPDAAIRLVVGVIAVSFTLNHWLGLSQLARNTHPGTIAGVLWGGASGIASFLANSGGPPFQIYVLPHKLPKETFVGTYSVFFAAGNALKVVPYFLLGQLSATNVTTSLTLLPLAIATNVAGVWLVRRTPAEFFYKVIYVLIFLIGLQLIYTGVDGIARG
ncbi:MAG TPA: sulfite exporter TauE/SafE family protein [Pseudolabrys sp.]|nr:sulfite exporter TauE/SafE family protein [Pseudolabrys sp.]